MKSRQRHRVEIFPIRFLRAAAGRLIILAGIFGLEAADPPVLPSGVVITKADNADALAAGSSWVLGSVPGPAEVALWDGIYANGTASVGGGVNVYQVRLLSPSAGITISSGTGSLTLGAGGIDLSASTQNLTISAPVVVGANQTWTAAAGRTVAVSGAISGGGAALDLAGGGAFTFSGNSTYAGTVNVKTGAALTITSAGRMMAHATVGVSTGNATINFVNSGKLDGGLTIAAGSGVASPNANELPLIATGIAQLKGGSRTGAIRNQGQLTLSDSTQIAAIGTIGGDGGMGGINDNNTFAGGKTLVFADGAHLSYYKPANGANATLRVEGGGTARFSYFGFSSAINISYTTAFDGGSWVIGKLGRANTGAQFAGTANIVGGASVTVQSPGFEHGNWNVKDGTLSFLGTIAEAQGPISHNIGLNLSVDHAGGGSSALNAGALVLGLGAANTAPENNSLSVGAGGAAIFSSGNVTVGTAFNHAGAEVNTVSLGGGKLVVAGALQAASTVGANQTRQFHWTGGQLTAGTIVAGAGFNGANSTLSVSGLQHLAGTLAPGDAGTAGKTTVSGNYTLGSAGVLAVDLGGTTQATGFQTGMYDFLTVTGSTTLSGALAVRVLPGFTPAGNQTFTILSSTGPLSGGFSNVAFGGRLVSENGLASFVVTKSGSSVVLGQYLPVTVPAIAASTAPTTVVQGNTVTLEVTASSLVPVTYQWRKNGIAIAGATSARFTIYGAQPADSGSYDVVVSNSAGSSTSAAFPVTATLPRVADGIVVDAGSTRAFDATPAAAAYAWRLDGRAVGSDAASFSYAPDVQDVGTHWLEVRETYADGTDYTRRWGVRVRIPEPTGAIQYYVSPGGSDSGDGSLDAPFLTLEKARDKIRTLARPLPPGGVTVYLRGGTYVRTATLTLNASDSGSAGAPVVYRNYPGETAILSGGKRVASAQFSPLASSEVARAAPGVDTSRIWELDLVALGITKRGPFPNTFGEWQIFNALAGGSAGLCEVFYNGSRMRLSRYPNHNLADDTQTANLKVNGIAAGADNAGTGYLNAAGNYTTSTGSVVPVGGAFHFNTADAAHVARWQTAMTKGGVWVVGYWRVPWQINGAKVGVLDTGAKQAIGLASGVSINGGIGYKYSRPAGNKAEPWWVVNLLEELDQPGEWCIDFSRNRLYFLMDAAGAPPDNSIVISDLGSPIIQISGSHVNIRGLTFEHGLAQGVQVLGGSRNLVAGCTFRNMGGYPVELNNVSGGTHNGVLSCEMSDLASGGVLTRGGNGTATPRVPANNFVVNNRIKDYARVVRVYAAAVDVGYSGAAAVGMRVAHNTTSGSPHVGMLWRGYDHHFEYNDISDYCQFSNDMGGIYTYASNYVSGTTIRYNYLHDSDHGEGVYFDSDHINATVYGNVVNLRTLASESRGTGFYDQVPGGTPAPGVPLTDTLFNNVAVNCRFGFQIYSDTGGKIENNLAFNNLTAGFKWNKVGVSGTSYTTSTSNATVLGSGPNAAYATDPGFVNFAGDDFRLRPDSVAFDDMPGFEPIPLEMMGLFNDEFRSDAMVYPPFVTTGPAANPGSNVATFRGTLAYPQFEANADVLLYWGTSDGGTDPAAWQNVESLGRPASGDLAKTLTSLAPDTQYFYRFFASNSAGSMWAEESNAVTTYSANSVAAGGTPSASLAALPAANAFDGNPATVWQAAAGTGWIAYEMPEGAAVTEYRVTSASDFPARDPKDWEFLGSNDGATWDILDARSGQDFSSRGETRAYGVANDRPYKYYRLNITANHGDPGGLQLAEWQMLAPLITADITGPVITTPGNLVIAAGSSSGAYVDYTVTAIDAVSGVAAATVSPASGSLLPIGTTTVTVSATDAAGNASAASFTVTVTPPALPNPWTVRNVGTYNSLGTASFLAGSGSLTVNATGGTSGITGDIWTGNNDSFTYISQPWTGNGIFTARVASFTATDGSAKAGIMLRESTNVGSKYGFTYLLRKGDAWSQHKAATSGSSSGVNFFTASSAGKGLPYWIRLVRQGNDFTSYISSNGTTWVPLGSARTVSLGGNAITVGFAVGPRTASGTATATFDNISFLGVPAAPAGLASTAGSGQVSLTWSPVPTATSYSVMRADAPGGGYVTVASGLLAPAYVDAGLTPGTSAAYVVTAANAAGEGASSPELAAGPLGALAGWRSDYFATQQNLGDASDSADPDRDGLPNLVEYALGSNPQVASPSDSPALNSDGRFLKLSFRRIADPLITYRVEANSDLSATWTPVWQSTGIDNAPGWIDVADTVDLSTATPPRRFLRLRITAP